MKIQTTIYVAWIERVGGWIVRGGWVVVVVVE